MTGTKKCGEKKKKKCIAERALLGNSPETLVDALPPVGSGTGSELGSCVRTWTQSISQMPGMQEEEEEGRGG